MKDKVTISPNIIAEAAILLRNGQLVAVPTETVYGLAADATNNTAVARIFEAKGRPSFNPLIIHVQNLAMAKTLGAFSPGAEKLAHAFWPGPLTIVVPRQEDADASRLVSAGLETIALRVPAAPVAQDLLKAFGKPFAAPSANPSGQISPTTAAHVRSGLGDKVQMILDGGPCVVGVESTIIAVDEDQTTLLRPGGLPVEDIENLVGPVSRHDNKTILAPGMMSSHYAPKATVRLNAERPAPGEMYIGFGNYDHGPHNLSRSGDLVEAAANLFAALHATDIQSFHIAVAPIPMTGLGIAINDRLTRAAAPRGQKEE